MLNEYLKKEIARHCKNDKYLINITQWFIENLLAKLSSFSCESKKRYIGFYNDRHTKIIDIDVQRRQLKVGILDAKKYEDAFKQIGVTLTTPTAWFSSPDTLTLIITDKNEDCLNLIADIVNSDNQIVDHKLKNKSNLNDWYPLDYDPGFTVGQWVELINDPEVFNTASLEVMKRMLNEEDCVATCTQLANKYGNAVNFYNKVSSALAERIVQKTGCSVQKREDGSTRWWAVLYLGKSASKEDPGSYLWKLRDNLADALKQVDLSDVKLYANGENEVAQMTENPMIAEFKKLLLSSKQIILTGAPGTGKTYLAKQVAYALTGDNAESSPHIEFCQFHPSFDYTDFVEGLRPVPPQGESKSIGFERKDGIFKAFCKKALEKNVNNFDEAYRKFTDFLSENHDRANALVLNTPNNASFKVFLNSRGSLSLMTGQKDEVQGSLTPEKIKTFLTETPYEFWAGYYKGVIEYLKKNFNLIFTSDKDEQKYVFIIDEINRGDISKIFGELFFAIDPGYRGENGTVKTQYSNLLSQDDPYHNGFFIPDNVYIIGTMNDIDRSVESMDFAIRRRFTWKEIEAKDAVGMWDSTISEYKDEALEKMTRLNEVIEQTESLSKAFHIGPAYFLKLKEYNGDFQKLWDLHILPLLKEYLRGTFDSETALENLSAAYSGSSNSATGE